MVDKCLKSETFKEKTLNYTCKLALEALTEGGDNLPTTDQKKPCVTQWLSAFGSRSQRRFGLSG